MAKRHPRFRPRVSRPPAARLARGLAIAAIATAGGLLVLASPSLASTGTVFFDANGNVAAGDPAHLSTRASQATSTPASAMR